MKADEEEEDGRDGVLISVQFIRKKRDGKYNSNNNNHIQA